MATIDSTTRLREPIGTPSEAVRLEIHRGLNANARSPAGSRGLIAAFDAGVRSRYKTNLQSGGRPAFKNGKPARERKGGLPFKEATMFRSILVTVAAAGVVSTAYAQGDPWSQRGDWLKSQIDTCKAATSASRDVCRYLAAEALRELFGIEDFCPASACMTGPEIEAALRNDPHNWSVLGSAVDQAVLDKARELADQGKAVVAGHNAEHRSQVAIIMPGKAVPSGKWAMERVPLGVAARSDAPERSIYAEGINWVFSDPARVTLYVRQ